MRHEGARGGLQGILPGAFHRRGRHLLCGMERGTDTNEQQLIDMYEWENKRYQLLLKGSEAAGVVEEWAERNTESDLRIRRAKTPGHAVIETCDVMFAAKIRQMYPSCRVNITELKG